MKGVLFSEDLEPISWSEVIGLQSEYGPKGAMLLTLPRLWTPPFVLLSTKALAEPRKFLRDPKLIARLKAVSIGTGRLILRSSVIGESIWDRGSYKSVRIDASGESFLERLEEAIKEVVDSAPSRETGLVIQQYIDPRARGEFGNLLRISKTRDHWELSTDSARATLRTRLNTQRDEAASPNRSIEIRGGVPPERLFGSVAAWLNTYLLRGRSERLNCEWLTDNKHVFIVQLDQEDDDVSGVNPFQLHIPPLHSRDRSAGQHLKPAEGAALRQWDKLKVLEELWEPKATHKPTLFYVPLTDLQGTDLELRQALESDVRKLVGDCGIVVRTSGRTGVEKQLNLPRSECLHPDQAAEWCVTQLKAVSNQDRDKFAFVAHRFLASKASAWVRAEPGNPVVEIHALWGLPDALQFCPYDIWEVHLPTEVATEYPEYKSNILIARSDGGWEYVRVRNDLARNLCISKREALDLASRTAAIATRLGRACHVMWFVGCVDADGASFNMPWYWTEAHEAEKNVDRSNYQIVPIADERDLDLFKNIEGSRARQAIELIPTRLELMRDNAFIESVGAVAAQVGVPVILAGSTLAHAYYQLRRQGCTILARGEKDHSRVRRHLSFGKLVRDKIPQKISGRGEIEATKKIPGGLVKGFLTSKLLEEAMEVRSAEGAEQKTLELADLYEVLRALARSEGVPLEVVAAKADEKKGKAGGFDEGLVLVHTGIPDRKRGHPQEGNKQLTQVLARRVSGDTYEIPFSFFGFMELDTPRSLRFDDLGVRLDVVLRSDRIELRLSSGSEQLELPLDLTLPIGDENPEVES
jgi:predicted house-cleaning noncanonical NTP pyrophosphatase (MazG superfamily)